MVATLVSVKNAILHICLAHAKLLDGDSTNSSPYATIHPWMHPSTQQDIHSVVHYPSTIHLFIHPSIPCIIPPPLHLFISAIVHPLLSLSMKPSIRSSIIHTQLWKVIWIRIPGLCQKIVKNSRGIVGNSEETMRNSAEFVRNSKKQWGLVNTCKLYKCFVANWLPVRFFCQRKQQSWQI